MDSFQAVADPTRRAMLELLAEGERAAGEIGARFTISAPAVSQHLKVLREAGLVSVRVDAQRRIYRLEPEALQELSAWVHDVTRYWNTRLDRLESVLRAEDERNTQPERM